ncbi:MAG: glycosyltransferase family 9 protein [Magnetococcales bacterium]|nr:glycosyltransferase family 9 protein [Magnetococcales bacterium]
MNDLWSGGISLWWGERVALKRVIVFQTWGIGDLIMATPMLAALRQELPRAFISMVAGTAVAGQVIAGSGLCDDIKILLPGKMPVFDLVRWFARLRREKFDAAIVCTRLSPKIALFLRLFSRIRIIVGDSHPKKYWGYTHWVLSDSSRHRVELNMAILRLLFPDAACGHLTFAVPPEAVAEGNAFWRQADLQGRLVLGVHPGGSSNQKNKRLPLGRLKRVISGFLEASPAARVVVFLGADELELASQFTDAGGRVVIVSGLPLNVAGHVIGRLDVLLAGDTGLGHIAAAMDVPVVTLIGPTNANATRPWHPACRVIRLEQELPCMPCVDTPAYYTCPNPICLRNLDAEHVLATILDLLATKKVHQDRAPPPSLPG